MPRKEKPCIGKTFAVGSIHVVVEDVIAEGGFALVFLTKDNNGRRFALKRMYVNTDKDLAMCQQEIHILEFLAKEQDSHAVRYWASAVNVIDEEVKEVLILLDYYKASVLQLMNERFQTKRQLTEEEVLNIFCDVCHAVGKLHNQRPPWIHRDLKVENILIDKDGRCVLCDFGSATNRVFDPTKHPVTEIEEDLKKYTTIAYRSPEMVNLYGTKKPVTIKADIWALGVMLYKMCYFTLPFGESSLAIQNCNLHFPSSPSYSKQLQGLIRYCLRVDPEDRPDIFQVAYLACWLAKRECGVLNRNKTPVPNPDILLTQPETVPAPAPNDTSPPRVARPPPVSTFEFSSTTSIAPRERPKPSAQSAGALVLPRPPSKFGGAPLTPVSAPPPPLAAVVVPPVEPVPVKESVMESKRNFDLIDISAGDTVQQRSAVAAVPPPPGGSGIPRGREAFGDMHRSRLEEVGQKVQRMGHRRNTSDTSMIPIVRPASPSPTQNISEKSRSADTSPVRSPNPRTDVNKQFSAWNPFEDVDQHWTAPKPPSLTQSITSLVRKGSVNSMTRLAVGSPAENGEKDKKNVKTTEKKEKKKFKYQKFDNDSDEEDGSVISDQPHSQSESDTRKSVASVQNDSETVKDTDSIGSASDLKHEDDTTDDEHLSSRHTTQPDVEIKVEEEEEDDHYGTVQYGTLEETASAIQSLASHLSLGHETSTKPLLDDHNNGFDKSDDEELERKATPVAAGTQRRLTFDGAGLLSVFDQIPFRQPKKPKDAALIPPVKKEPVETTHVTPAEAANRQQLFPETNPFADCFAGSGRRRSEDKPDSVTDVAETFTEPFEKAVPVIAPPPVPPKPSFLKRDVQPAVPSGVVSQNPYATGYAVDNGEDVFGASPFDNLTDSLVASEKSAAASGKKKTKSPVFQESLMHATNIVAPNAHSPTHATKFRKFQKKEGISNISFEDA
ncbi:serine/threonine-protein kinase sel-5-like [Paramacrobiotus metropolitanus]|uniref:serine/threonine-protein kinase sel-5-like n=1 Tax=Paramacrobiotus metropolitanus TaxID=2943436 RepID=UPI002446151A|nr:serine/threonine-protein kinase sel-5-like [Paramacrobiotus metropolitanus]